MAATKEFSSDVSLRTVGLAQAAFVKHFLSDSAIAVGDLVEAGATNGGRVQSASAVTDTVIGVALSAAGGAGTDVRVALRGVAQVMVDTGTATTVGVTALGPGASGKAYAAALTGSLIGVAAETSASGTNRLVWVHLIPAPAVNSAMFVFARGGTVLVPAASTFVNVWRAPFACTVTAVKGLRVGGTGMTINARKNGASDHLASALSLTSADTWLDGGSVQNTAYAVGDRLEISIVTVAGSPTQGAVQVDFVRT